MPTLEFKGKQHIYAHHLTVPYRPLEPDENRSCNPSDTDDNLIIHGDNLHALKALLPRYANRIKCIYINPPYNTGNEGWIYNDNVNSPLIRQWLTENAPIDNKDLERHDRIQHLPLTYSIQFLAFLSGQIHWKRKMMMDCFIATTKTITTCSTNLTLNTYAATPLS